jgi:hypothetical protein
VSGVEKAPFSKKHKQVFHISGFSENRKKIVSRLPTFFSARKMFLEKKCPISNLTVKIAL